MMDYTFFYISNQFKDLISAFKNRYIKTNIQ